MPENNIQQLVQTSYLPEDQKKYLLQYINANGDNQEFYNLFNQYLIDSLNIIKKDYTIAMKKFNDDLLQFDKEFKVKEDQNKDNLEKELSGIKPENITEKNKIWDKYYSSRDKINTEQEEKIKDLLSKNIVSTM